MCHPFGNVTSALSHNAADLGGHAEVNENPFVNRPFGSAPGAAVFLMEPVKRAHPIKQRILNLRIPIFRIKKFDVCLDMLKERIKIYKKEMPL